MHCPRCGCHVFSTILDFSGTDNNIHQELTYNDIVTCEHCNKESLIGELEPDKPEKLPNEE